MRFSAPGPNNNFSTNLGGKCTQRTNIQQLWWYAKWKHLKSKFFLGFFCSKQDVHDVHDQALLILHLFQLETEMQFHPLPDIATWHIHLRFHAPRRSTCGSWRLTGDGVVMKWVEIGYIRLIWRYTWYTRVSAFRKKPLFLIQVLSNSSTSLWSTEVGLPDASPNQSLHLSSLMSTQIFYLRLHHPGLIGPSTTG